MENNLQTRSLLYAVDEKPPVWMAVFLAIQHVLIMFSGVIIVPTIVAKSSNIPPEEVEYVAFASIIVASISSFIQAIRFGKVGSGYVLFMGTSGAFISCSLVAVELGGFGLVATMSIVAAPIEILFSYFLRYLRNIITPAVGGVVIMLVVVTVMPIALNLWTGTPGTPEYGSFENLIVGLLTFAVILALAIFGGTQLRLSSPIVGAILGYCAAWYFGILDTAHFNEAPFFGLPRGHWPGITFQFTASHIALLATFCVATLVGAIESVGDAMAVQRVSERNFTKVNYDSVQGCLYADGIGNFLAGLAGTVPNTTYSGNIAMIELTGVASRRVGVYGAAILAVLAFFPKLSAIVIDIPGPVLGACLFIFMSMLFVTGIKVATMSGINYQSTIVVGISFLSGSAMETKQFFNDIIPEWLGPLLSNGISTGGITAFLLSLIFYLKPRRSATLRLTADPKLVGRLHEFVEELSGTFRMREKQILLLQLACEEVFTHICDSHVQNGQRGTVRFDFVHEREHIEVEIEDRSTASDVDAPRVPTDLGQAEPADLAELGLVLLNRVATDVSHIRISGFNYISFKVPSE